MYDELVKGLRDAFKTATEAQVNPYRFVPFYQKAADAIEELSKSRWIPATEEPPRGERVLACCRDGWIFIGKDFSCDETGGELGDSVLWWMPLPPPPPKEEA